jgi:hypothetical protein
MIDENQFWNLIAEAKAAAKNTDEIPNWLEQRLSKFTAEEILDFGSWLATFLNRSNDGKLWAAASIIASGCSDDGFVYFQCWLIAQGKTIYENAIANPDSLADIEYVDCGQFGPEVELEELLYVSSKAYKNKGGKPIDSQSGLHGRYEPPPGSQIKRTARKNPGFLTQSRSTVATAFPKLVKRFNYRNES